MNDHPTSDDSDDTWPDGTPVLTPYPLTPEQVQGDRASWPWLPASIASQCGPNEWSLVIEDERATTAEDGTGESLYPVVFRDASEIRLPDPTVEELREIFFDEHGQAGGFMP